MPNTITAHVDVHFHHKTYPSFTHHDSSPTRATFSPFGALLLFSHDALAQLLPFGANSSKSFLTCGACSS